MQRFAVSLLDLLSDPTVIAMFRLAISAAEESPMMSHLLEDNARAPNRKALVELMTRACKAGRLTGDPAAIAAHFVALVTSDLQVPLLLGLVTRPGAREMERPASAATDAFLRLHEGP